MTTSEKTLRIHKAMLKNRRAARAALVAMQRKKGRNQGQAAEALEATVARRDKLDKDLYIQLKFIHSELRRLEERCTTLEERCTTLEERCTAFEERCGALEERSTTLEKRCTALEDRVYLRELTEKEKAIIKSNTDTKLEIEEEDTSDGSSSGGGYFIPRSPSPPYFDQVDDFICLEE